MNERIERVLPWCAAGIVVLGAVVAGVRTGAPAAVLWAAFGVLALTVYFLWEGVREVVARDRTPVDEDHADAPGSRIAVIEARKRAALKALKDVEFEYGLGRLSDDDRDALRERYRAEARAAMESMDAALERELIEAERILAHAETVSPDAPVASIEPAANASPVCASCGTRNDTDAVFCKKCGAKVAA